MKGHPASSRCSRIFSWRLLFLAMAAATCWRLFHTFTGKDLMHPMQQGPLRAPTPGQLAARAPTTKPPVDFDEEEEGSESEAHRSLPLPPANPPGPGPSGDDQAPDAEETVPLSSVVASWSVPEPSQSTSPTSPGRCPKRAKAPKKWAMPPASWMEIIKKADVSVIESCEKRGDALIMRLDITQAKRLPDGNGFAYEMAFPDYIVSDEVEGGWRERRSTLQLFLGASAVVGGTSPSTASASQVVVGRPLGPAHADHDVIADEGNGAFSHWREAITDGPQGYSKLRFSLPKNMPLKAVKADGGLLAVVFPMAPPMGWIEYPGYRVKKHQETFRELMLRTLRTVGVNATTISKPKEVTPKTHYVWRVSGDGEFDWKRNDSEIYQMRLPYRIAEHYEQFEKAGGVLFPPPASYRYYQNKVGLAKLFKERGVKTPTTWVFKTLQEALLSKSQLKFPVIVKDPYGFSSYGIMQASTLFEFEEVIKKFFSGVQTGVEAIVQRKVIALREARVTYMDGRPYHGYWRVRKDLKSASAASSQGGFQSFDFPLKEAAENIALFAKKTGVPVGGVDWIWEEAQPDPKVEAYTLEVSPTSDLNPPSPPSWTATYKEFKDTPGYRPAFLAVRRTWADLLALAVIDRYRRSRKHLFVDIDNVCSLSAARVARNKGSKASYSAKEVLQDEPVPDAAEALRTLRPKFFIRLLTARKTYENAFETTQLWLFNHGFQYDELIVVNDAEDKEAHLTSETLLVDDFTLGHHKAETQENTKLIAKLKKAGLPFVKFPLGGLWADVMPEILDFANKP